MRPAPRLSPRPLVVTALLAAILLLAQISLSFLPNIELVTLLLLCYTAVFPLRQVLGAVLVFDLLEGILYGFGLWWVMYLYVWPIWVLLSLALRRTSSGVVRGVRPLLWGPLRPALPGLWPGGSSGQLGLGHPL